MNQDEYIKQLEASNYILQEKLDKAQNVVDRIHDNPLQESLTLLIDACLKHQKKLRANNRTIRFEEFAKLNIYLPRQIGLTTCIRRACEFFFDEVHTLTFHPSLVTKANNIHRSVTDIPNGVSCVIIDPWSGISKQRGTDIDSIVEKIYGKLDLSKPCLLVLAG